MIRGSTWSLISQGVVLLVSLATTPVVIRLLGPEAYGAYTMAVLLIGFLDTASVGSPDAAVRFASEAHGAGDRQRQAAAVWTALAIQAAPLALMIAVVGSLGGVIAGGLLPRSPGMTASLAGALTGFAVGTALRMMAGVWSAPQLARMSVGPVTLVNTGATLAFTLAVPLLLASGAGLPATGWAAAGVWALAVLVHCRRAFALLPELAPPRYDRLLVRPMLRFGLYSAGVTLLGLAQMHGEKLLLAQAMAVSAVGWYGVSFTLSRLPAMVPAATGQALLPAMSRLQALADPDPLARLYSRSLWTLARILAPLALLTALAGPPFLTFWAGPDYGRSATPALQILLAGCVLDGVSYAPRILLSAMGVPNRIVWFQLPVLPLYLAAAWYLVGRWGIAGGAAAWSLRASTEAVLAHLLAARELRARRRVAKFRVDGAEK